MEYCICNNCERKTCENRGKMDFTCNAFWKETPYTEIFKLKQLLDLSEIPYNFNDRSIIDKDFIEGTKYFCKCWDNFQIECYNEREGIYISVIEGYGTYGQSSNLLEIMKIFEKEKPILGYLTAEEVFNIIIEHRKG